MAHAEEPFSRHDRQDVLDQNRQLWIDTLSHARHDWMNDLQLILGYVQLRKYDKLAGCVDMLKQKMTEESRICKLGHLGLIETLLTYRTRPRPFVFGIHIEEGVPDLRWLPETGNAAEFAVRRMLTSFELAASEGARGSDQTLDCAFEREQEGAVTVRFHYRGTYEAKELGCGVEAVRTRWSTVNKFAVIKGEFHPMEAQVTLQVPIGGEDQRCL